MQSLPCLVLAPLEMIWTNLTDSLRVRLNPGVGPGEKSSLLDSLTGSAGALWGAEPQLQPLPAH